MIVDLSEARDAGLTLEYGDRRVRLPRGGLPDDLRKGLEALHPEGRCCLSDASPKVVEALDVERAADSEVPASTGICVAAESGPA